MPTSNLPPVEAEAVHWLVLRRDSGMSAQDERAYQAWLGRDPAHRAAADKVERYWKMLGVLGEDPEIVTLTERRARESNRPVRALRFAALAASIAAAVGLGWIMRGNDVPLDPATPIRTLVQGEATTVAQGEPAAVDRERTFRTGVGESRDVTLADGSTVTLDTDSLMHTRQTADERVVTLGRGRAYFKVAKDPARSFRVVANDKTVVATGTEFAVDIESDNGVTVTLVEGSVRVEDERGFFLFRRLETVELKPGWQVVAAKKLQPEPVNLERAVSWTSGRLHFVNDSLGSAAEEMNRYSDKKIIIRDPAIRNQPIIGNFRTGDVDAFVRAVRLHGFAKVYLETPYIVQLGPPATG
jgi:transmembrane sensor